MNKPLEGLRVLELATVLAGPTVGMFLAELGAKVIKAENPNTGGDTTRKWKLPSEDPATNYSSYFCSVNWGKEHLFIDMKIEAGQKQVAELVKGSDIVLTNFRKVDAKKFNLDRDSLFGLKSDLVIGNITGYGEESSRPAFDAILQAESGYMFMNGQPESDPVKMPVALIDVLCAHQLKEGLLLALLYKEKTGKGSYVSVSLFDSAISALTNQASNWLMNDQIPQRIGSLHPNIAPYGEILRSQDDSMLVLAVGNNKQFKALCNALGLGELVEDLRFMDNHLRIENRNDLLVILQAQAGGLTIESLIERLNHHEVPCGQIKDMREVFESPAAKQMILEEVMPDGTISKRVSDIAFRLWTR